jgi:DNA-binding response OmpR family regulator
MQSKVAKLKVSKQMNDLIVIVEDELDLLELLEYHFKKAGYDVEGFLEPSRIEDIALNDAVSLMVLDRNLPGIEGTKLLQNLRDKGFEAPVLFLSAKTSQEQRIEGFEAGCDDYVTKPFNINELLFRVKALLKRANPHKTTLKYRDITILLESQQAFVDGVEQSLTKLEYALLLEMIQRKNIVLSREALLTSVWKNEEQFQDRTVDVAVKRLKEKIDPNKEKNYIQSIRGVGYKFC